ncbi:phospholipase D-like domain-containing protein [Phenylobacterium immobile]|uniref:phospholipase D-like domain-containing protein n=1 Tax=Phenylobacterium immobile TaxID=21 RepID=UPI000A5B39CE|nr:phospholipase D-like domain-containing protein [Phenylobacterium immobile]
MLLKRGATCWRAERTPRAAVFIDVEDYFTAVMSAISKARRSVHILGWAFHPLTHFAPQVDCADPQEARIAAFLKAVSSTRPELDIRVLCWKAALPIAITQDFYPQRAAREFRHTSVRFELDDQTPLGASHHQKVVVIDDAVAFCGGCDFGPDRWDTCDHEDENLLRAAEPGAPPCFDPRHEVMSLVDGHAAEALGELFRARWLRATGETMTAPNAPAPSDPWPDAVTPQFEDVRVGLSRTAAAWAGEDQIRENEALYLAAIAAAKSCIYMENQYFTSPVIAEALAQRLGETKGPEVILVSTGHAPSYFDQLTMDRTRSFFIRRLEDADKHGRFRIYSPVTALGHTIIVHAKLAIIDDVLLRVGSANINNRSLGLDTECDLSIEPMSPTRAETRLAIGRVRTRLVAHWLGCEDVIVSEAVEKTGGLGAAIEWLRAQGRCRLRPIPAVALKPMASLVATFHLGDPVGPKDSWKPWRRRRSVATELKAVVASLKQANLDSVPARLSAKAI